MSIIDQKLENISNANENFDLIKNLKTLWKIYGLFYGFILAEIYDFLTKIYDFLTKIYDFLTKIYDFLTKIY